MSDERHVSVKSTFKSNTENDSQTSLRGDALPDNWSRSSQSGLKGLLENTFVYGISSVAGLFKLNLISM